MSSAVLGMEIGEEKAGKVKVSYGVNDYAMDWRPKLKVGNLRKELSQVLGFPAGATALVNGQEVKDKVAVKEGDEVTFVKESGAKS